MMAHLAASAQGTAHDCLRPAGTAVAVTQEQLGAGVPGLRAVQGFAEAFGELPGFGEVAFGIVAFACAGHPAFTGLRCRLDGEPRFAHAGLAQDQDGMPFADFGYPGDVLAKQVKLELPVGVNTAPGGWETWRWAESLFAGAARYYEQGRLPYAPDLAGVFARSLALDGRGRLLDVGCGPGTVTLRLAPLFEAAVGNPRSKAC